METVRDDSALTERGNVVASAANLAILFSVLVRPRLSSSASSTDYNTCVQPTCRYMFNMCAHGSRTFHSSSDSPHSHSPQRALHSILASRTVLHLKEMAAQRLVEYDSNERPPPQGFFQNSGGSGSGKSHPQDHGESYVLSEFQAAGPGNVQSIDTFGYNTQLETGDYGASDDSRKARGIDAELYGYGGSPTSPPRFEPLRRQRTSEWDDEDSRGTNRSKTPLQGPLKIFVQRQQTQHL